jgi:hypothetical protein
MDRVWRALDTLWRADPENALRVVQNVSHAAIQSALDDGHGGRRDLSEMKEQLSDLVGPVADAADLFVPLRDSLDPERYARAKARRCMAAAVAAIQMSILGLTEVPMTLGNKRWNWQKALEPWVVEGLSSALLDHVSAVDQLAALE